MHMARVNAGRRTREAMNAAGNEFYGFSTDLVAHLIEGLPGADKCEGYVFRATRAARAGGGSATPGPGPKAAKSKKRARLEAGDDDDPVPAADDGGGDDGSRKSAVRVRHTDLPTFSSLSPPPAPSVKHPPLFRPRYPIARAWLRALGCLAIAACVCFRVGAGVGGCRVVCLCL